MLGGGSYTFDADGAITCYYDMGVLSLYISGQGYEWTWDEDVAAESGMTTCTWYSSASGGAPYVGSCPISLGGLTEPKNENGYITRIINSF